MSDHAALSAIRAAQLPTSIYRTARELLDRAHPDNGFVCVTLAELGEITGVTSEGAARRHLTKLQAAQIIHYSINGDAHVRFCAWTRNSGAEARAESDHPRADSARDITKSEEQRAESARQTAETDHVRSESDHVRAESDHAVIRGDLVGGLSLPSLPEETNQPTNQDAGAGDPEPTDAQRSLRILLDSTVGVARSKAVELAARHSFEFIRRHVAAWLLETKRGKGAGVGLLIYRIEKGGEPPVFGREFRETELFQRHRTPADLEAEAEFFPPPPDVAAISPPPAPPDHTETWKVVAWEAKTGSIPETLWGPLQDSLLVRGEDVDGLPSYAVILPAGTDRALMENRMGRFVKKTLGSLLKQQCSVEFVVAESETAL